MFKYVLALALCLSLVSAYGYYEDECDVNEQSVECVNPCNTCAAKGVPCMSTCSPGCDCLPGHLRNRTGFCIPTRFCGRPQKRLSHIIDGDLVEGRCLLEACNEKCKPKRGFCDPTDRCICR
ncbi:hypothetical protein NPIL_369111 [Nephila pilipes]|uniref:TIL domain-containing protein n=1 Tax=Nephila pilipes TaxID=299642 RepID=A0A8X6UUP2_NEPPI|nr:hypothetical protein NPIL_369111 [Nephila pilipes]